MWKQESATMLKTPTQEATRKTTQFGLETMLATNQKQYLPANFTTQKTILIQKILFLVQKMKKHIYLKIMVIHGKM